MSILDYLAGLVYGDGAFYYDIHSRMYHIYIYDKEEAFLRKIEGMITKELGIRSARIREIRVKNSFELRFSRKEVFEELRNFIKENMTNPSLEFIRGLTDAEGTIYLDKYNGLTLEISNINQELLGRICRVLKNYKIRCSIIKNRRKPPRKTLYKIRIRRYPKHPRLLRRKPLGP